MSRTTAPGWTRREALELLGMSAAAAALPGIASAQSGVTFPKGAIIRTILKDYPPEELAGGPTCRRPGHLRLHRHCREEEQGKKRGA